MNKTLLFSILLSFLSLNAFANPNAGDEYKVIISEKKIWIMADETPVSKLLVQIKDKNGKVVIEKTFSSKNADWSLSVTDLSEGEYSIWIGAEKSATFRR